MEPVDKVDHSELLLLHSRLTAIVNWIHSLERSVNDSALSSPLLCARLRRSVLMLASALASIDVAQMNNRISLYHYIFLPT